MLVPLPVILHNSVEHKNGQWVLKEGATQEQMNAFEDFIKELNQETIVFE